ncbi:hypothetical protein FG386_001224 [Cryptosporidium ryanae]|uniref:uncharacterized protein n=1 Tax=Cryptosporidium ryanae TaxID=515981 RepID=UPI00351A7359|nr:hypothetical protein FG386_001224 [Cryptosporidium ryanae]
MERLLDCIFNCTNNEENNISTDLITYLENLFSYTCRRNRYLFKKKLELECETLFVPVLQENSEDGSNIKRRAVEKYSELSFLTIIDILTQKNLYHTQIDLLVEFLILILSSKSVIIRNFSEDKFLFFTDILVDLLGKLVYAEGHKETPYILVSKISDLYMEIVFMLEEINENILEIVLQFLKKIIKIFSQGINPKIAKSLGESQIMLFKKVIRSVHPGKMNEFIKIILVFLEEVVFSNCFEDLNDIISLFENILIGQILSFDELISSLCTHEMDLKEANIGDEKDETHLIAKTNLIIGFIYTILKLMIKNKTLLDKISNSEQLNGIINQVILNQTLGLVTHENKQTNEQVFETKNSCYVKTLLSGDRGLLTILQKFFTIAPLLISLSKGNMEKIIGHLHKMLEIQEQGEENSELELRENHFSRFSLLFPVLCEACCSVEIRYAIPFIRELIFLFEFAVQRINILYCDQESSLYSFLEMNPELLSIIHIPSFTYLLLFDVHLFSKGVMGTGKFLLHFLIWCSKYEENYVLYYTAYCITRKIKILAEDEGLMDGNWLCESVKLLFYIMMNYSFGGKSNTYNTGRSCTGDNSILVEFIKRPVLSSKQTYCFICALNIIYALTEAGSDLHVKYFKEKLDKIGKSITSIIDKNGQIESENIQKHSNIDLKKRQKQKQTESKEKNEIGFNECPIGLGHLRCILLFVPLGTDNRGITKSIRQLFKNLIEITTRFDSNRHCKLPGVDLEACLCGWIMTLFYVFSIRNIPIQISGCGENFEEEVENEIETENECNEELKEDCNIAYKIFRDEVEKVETCFLKLLDFYKDRSLFINQYIDSFSVFATTVEYMGFTELKARLPDRKLRKYAKVFGREKMTEFYKATVQTEKSEKKEYVKECTSYRCLLSILRYGILGFGSKVHSLKSEEIIESVKCLEVFNGTNLSKSSG